MKKIIFIITAAVLILSAGVGIYYYKTRLTPVEIEDVLPSKPLFYIRVANVEVILNEIGRASCRERV